MYYATLSPLLSFENKFNMVDVHSNRSLCFGLVCKERIQRIQEQTLLWTCVAGAHLHQCVNNYYAKFEYEGMKSVLITDYIQINKVSNPKVVYT